MDGRSERNNRIDLPTEQKVEDPTGNTERRRGKLKWMD